LRISKLENKGIKIKKSKDFYSKCSAAIQENTIKSKNKRNPQKNKGVHVEIF